MAWSLKGKNTSQLPSTGALVTCYLLFSGETGCRGGQKREGRRRTGLSSSRPGSLALPAWAVLLHFTAPLSVATELNSPLCFLLALGDV